MAEEKKEKWLNYLALTTVISLFAGSVGIVFFANGFLLFIR